MNIYFIGEEGLFEDKDVKYTSIDEAYEYLKDKPVVSIDIETTRKFNGKYGEGEGLSPYLSKIIMFQIGDYDRQYIIDHRYHSIGKLINILTDPNVVKVGHNLKFEYMHILHNYKVRLVNIYDTQIAEMVLYCGIPDIEVGLKALAKRYLDKTIDKSTRLEFLKIKDRPFSYKQLEYGAVDIIDPLLFKTQQEIKIAEQQLENTINLEMLFTLVLGDIEYKGIHFNKDKWEALYNKNKPLLKASIEKLNDFVKKYYSDSKFITNQLDLFSEPGCTIMWSSSKQVIEFLVSLNACPKEFSKQTKKIDYTANAKVLLSSLNDMNKNQPEHIKTFIKDYISYKEFQQKDTTFGIDFFKYINPITKRLHSNYWQILATGRISSNNPNLQNIPSDEAYRECFDVASGFKIINSDYSGQETVVLANKSGEINMIKLINEGGDMHSFVASHISGKPYEDFMKMIHKKENKLPFDDYDKELSKYRQTAKAAGFAINYGGNGYTIAKNLGIPVEQGDVVYDAYFKAFPTLDNYFKKVKNQAQRLRYILIDEVTHRKSYFKPPATFKQVHAIHKKALNYPIQGESGSMTKYASVLYRKWLLENNYVDVISITNLVHDEINVEAEEKYAETAAQNLELCMKQAANMWCKKISMKATAVITNHWGH